MSHPIWQIGLFDKRDKDIVECLECNQMLKLSAGSIKGIKTHLFGKHKDSKYTEQYIRIEEGKSKQANKKITNYYTHSSGKLSVMDKNVINYIACCNNSISHH
uniref:BED-type domain-containing protein n=1 Tax=Meloidogyne hapla TaxID=6305 RepID=A0A1I8BWL1_MELHA